MHPFIKKNTYKTSQCYLIIYFISTICLAKTPYHEACQQLYTENTPYIKIKEELSNTRALKMIAEEEGIPDYLDDKQIKQHSLKILNLFKKDANNPESPTRAQSANMLAELLPPVPAHPIGIEERVHYQELAYASFTRDEDTTTQNNGNENTTRNNEEIENSADKHFHKANAFLRPSLQDALDKNKARHSLDMAIQEYENLLQQQGDSLKARYRLGALYLARRQDTLDFDQAKEHIDFANNHGLIQAKPLNVLRRYQHPDQANNPVPSWNYSELSEALAYGYTHHIMEVHWTQKGLSFNHHVRKAATFLNQEALNQVGVMYFSRQNQAITSGIDHQVATRLLRLACIHGSAVAAANIAHILFIAVNEENQDEIGKLLTNLAPLKALGYTEDHLENNDDVFDLINHLAKLGSHSTKPRPLFHIGCILNAKQNPEREQQLALQCFNRALEFSQTPELINKCKKELRKIKPITQHEKESKLTAPVKQLQKRFRQLRIQESPDAGEGMLEMVTFNQSDNDNGEEGTSAQTLHKPKTRAQPKHSLQQPQENNETERAPSQKCNIM